MELTLRARIASAAILGLLSLAVGVPLAAAQTGSLHLRLSGSPRSVVAGQQVTYIATVSNHRDSTIAQAAFRDRLPARASLVSATASQGACSSASPVVCDLGSLAAGASATVKITATANEAGLMVDRGWASADPPGHWRHGHLVVTRVRHAVSMLDLRLSGSPHGVAVGQQVTYTANLSNDGPAAIASAAFRNDLPGKASLVSATASQGSCASGSPVVCDLGSLAAGASATVTITATANEAGLMVDRGWVSADPPDHWRHGHVVVTRVRSASSRLDLRLSGAPQVLVAGQRVSYTAQVFNDGPGTIASAGFQDQLPGRASLVSATASQGSCASGSPVVCSLGSLAAGASATVTITATANQAGLMVDRGWVSANPPGNWRHERVVVTRVRPAAASLDLRLSGSPGSVVVGQQVAYTAQVVNDGAAAIASTAFQDQLPAAVSLVSATASQGSCISGSPVVCSLGSLAAGASATVTITTTANSAGVLVDRGWVSANPPGNWRHERLVVTRVRPAAASLDLRLSGSPGSVVVGQQVAYTAQVVNDGPAAISNAAFEDQLPAAVSLVAATASQGSCASGSPIVCSLGSLAAGASATVTITATANSIGVLVDRGWVSANPPGNWSHERLVVTRVRPAAASLDLTLSGSPGSVVVGQSVTYTAQVVNDGPAAIPSTAFQDQLPAAVSLVSTTASQGSCVSGSPVVCSLGSLAAGASATVTITATANDDGLAVDRGWVSVNPPGNWSHERLVVTRVRPAAASLGLQLSGSPGSVPVGQQVTYTATISNQGPAAVPTTAFQDTLPGKAAYVSASVSQGSCTGGSTVDCDLGSLAAGASATVTITATVVDPGPMVDRASVSANPPGHWVDQRVVVTVGERTPRTVTSTSPVTTTTTTTTPTTTGTSTTTGAATTQTPSH